MKVVDTIAAARREIGGARRSGRTIEFVPTMGALHDGHLELVRAAGRRGGLCVMSIFVNPLQFGPAEDFDSYPRDLDGDLALAEAEGVEVVFAPTAAEMYPGGAIQTRVEVGRLGQILEGAYRPGHFSGVATVCAKLFNIVAPDRVYLGQKDAQQVAVLRQVVRDLNLPLELVVCPTVREPDGLAMSSRNLRLDPEVRPAAAALYGGLQAAARAAGAGETSAAGLAAAARAVLDQQPAVRVQYLEVVHPQTFESLDEISGGALVVLAAHVGSVRLIDNCIVGTAQRPEREEVP